MNVSASNFNSLQISTRTRVFDSSDQTITREVVHTGVAGESPEVLLASILLNASIYPRCDSAAAVLLYY